MATPTLPQSISRENPQPEFSGRLIESLTEAVARVEERKPQQADILDTLALVAFFVLLFLIPVSRVH